MPSMGGAAFTEFFSPRCRSAKWRLYREKEISWGWRSERHLGFNRQTWALWQEKKGSPCTIRSSILLTVWRMNGIQMSTSPNLGFAKACENWARGRRLKTFFSVVCRMCLQSSELRIVCWYCESRRNRRQVCRTRIGRQKRREALIKPPYNWQFLNSKTKIAGSLKNSPQPLS